MRDEARQPGTGDKALSTVLKRLADADRQTRALAAGEASDYFRGRMSSQAETEAAVTRLVEAAIAHDEENVREAVLHACGDAVSYYDLPSALFEPLVPLMPRLSAELIGYVLAILGATHDPAVRSIIAPYASHPDAAVREEAVDALVELGGRPF